MDTTARWSGLAADLDVPPGARALAVLCHPHPNFGGDRHNVVVDALYRALPPAGVAAARFDFRRPVPDADLTPAVTDIATAVAAAVAEVPGVPVVLVGYSYGAAAALAASADHALAGLVLVAPPLAMWPGSAPAVPTLVLVPAHDQFSPPGAVEPVVATWPSAELEVVEMADHFLAGRTTWVADRVARWLTERS